MNFMEMFTNVLKRTNPNSLEGKPYFCIIEDDNTITIDGKICLDELMGFFRGIYKLGYRNGFKQNLSEKRRIQYENLTKKIDKALPGLVVRLYEEVR